MNAIDSESMLAHAGWLAKLELHYASEHGRTVPILRRHHGPLRIQKGLTPEGPEVWHQIIVHPPGGVAGGDELEIEVAATGESHVLLTTPGATKWYRSAQGAARQRIALSIESAARLEWLPLENIIFDGARARLDLAIDYEPGARFIGFDVYCLGRPASDETFDRGELRLQMAIRRAGVMQSFERSRIAASSSGLSSRVALAGLPVFGTFVAVCPQMNDDMLTSLRAFDLPGEWAATRINEILLVRWRGLHSDQALAAMRTLWARLRENILSRPACYPRIWRT